MLGFKFIHLIFEYNIISEITEITDTFIISFLKEENSTDQKCENYQYQHIIREKSDKVIKNYLTVMITFLGSG